MHPIARPWPKGVQLEPDRISAGGGLRVPLSGAVGVDFGKKPSYDSLYRALEAACAQLEGPVNLCGLSLGGILALQYGIEHPDKVGALALIGVPYPMPKGLLRLQNMIFYLMPSRVFQRMGWNKKDWIALCLSMAGLDFSCDLGKICCPALILCGAADRVNRAAAQRLSERIPGAKLAVISHAGHEVHVENPMDLGRTLAAFFLCNLRNNGAT